MIRIYVFHVLRRYVCKEILCLNPDPFTETFTKALFDQHWFSSVSEKALGRKESDLSCPDFPRSSRNTQTWKVRVWNWVGVLTSGSVLCSHASVVGQRGYFNLFVQFVLFVFFIVDSKMWTRGSGWIFGTSCIVLCKSFNYCFTCFSLRTPHVSSLHRSSKGRRRPDRRVRH